MTTQRDSDIRAQLVEAAMRDGMTAQQAERMADEAMGDIRSVRTQARPLPWRVGA